MNTGNFPLLQRILSGEMSVVNEVYVLLPIYFRSSLMERDLLDSKFVDIIYPKKPLCSFKRRLVVKRQPGNRVRKHLPPFPPVVPMTVSISTMDDMG